MDPNTKETLKGTAFKVKVPTNGKMEDPSKVFGLMVN
jgi:hypothetical protein